MAGFVITVAGIGILLALVGASSRAVAFAPGLRLIGLGLGVMLTPSVNIVQSSYVLAMVTLAVLALIGLAAAFRLPRNQQGLGPPANLAA